MPSRLQIQQLRKKFSDHILRYYHKMYSPIPGALLGWTESMLMWVILLSIIDIQHWNSTMELSPKVRAWIKDHAIRMYEDHENYPYLPTEQHYLTDLPQHRFTASDVRLYLEFQLKRKIIYEICPTCCSSWSPRC